MEDKKVKQFLSGGWYQWEGEDINVTTLSEPGDFVLQF
jgi:hypothetical protein